MPRDLSIYSFHPRRQHLTITLIVIVALAVFGLVRGLMSAADMASMRDAPAGASKALGQPATPVDLPPVTSLTPKVILPPPPPAAPAPKVERGDDAAAAAVNAPAAIPEDGLDATNTPAEPAPVVPVAPATPPVAAPAGAAPPPATLP